MYKRPHFFLFYFVILLFTYSCSKNSEEEFIKYSEIGPQSESNKNDRHKSQDEKDSTSSLVHSDVLNLDIENVFIISTEDFTDRFEHIETEKFLIQVDTDSILFKTWTYADSLSTMNAFYNLLDCFGPDCETIDLFSNEYYEKKYNLVLVSNKQIHWIQSKNNQSLLNWDRYLKSVYPTSSFHYIMEQRKNKQVEWLQRDQASGAFITLKDNI
jgi:hypothetical protein